ncbi:GDP-fucose protein O-fucosyltransferase 1-like [Mizuhopecten yessoensis]|uniref:GDP-fucose protein O-fucosyltransferase 1 n=1 Tax=Mizuhopecten yessoensis TaxID=6573 RepID=A0A210Q1R0_MIZYE|nr:GDP-fucose protein O-fucosyltransferase 1-like [Mizuhopecten yessoensis]OWF42645.1 GDP-fucose protein O-fucosyltransferase 1 [Mizuhopecten yessoensis]
MALQVLVLGLSVVFISYTEAIDVDPKGYILYCPCMGRFGNQADHFLGSLGFAKALDRTLVLPPWVEYQFPKPRSVQVPFDTYFKVEPLRAYHRVMTMESFMKELAPTIWPPKDRTVMCYQARHGATKGNSCNAKDGNPFGPFWDTFNIDFTSSIFYGPLGYDLMNLHEMKRWRDKYPASQYPVLAFTGAPAAFPVQSYSVHLHQYLKWSTKVETKADKFIKENFPERAFVAIHLRLGTDFVKACEHIKDSPNMFAAAQCIGYNGEYGKTTKEMCYPSDDTIVRQVKNAVKRIKAKGVFVATDSRDLIEKMSKAMKNVKFAKLSEKNPHVDLAILGKADHFIGNCISTFSGFVKRERDYNNKSSEFWAFKKKSHDEL